MAGLTRYLTNIYLCVYKRVRKHANNFPGTACLSPPSPLAAASTTTYITSKLSTRKR